MSLASRVGSKTPSRSSVIPGPPGPGWKVFVWPVVKIDEHVIGDGVPGPVAGKLREIYIETALARA